MRGNILTVNGGSSSIKFAIFASGNSSANPTMMLQGQIEGVGDAARFLARDASGQVLADAALDRAPGHLEAFRYLMRWLEDLLPGLKLAVAGHRVVHGGVQFPAPVLIDDAVMRALRALEPLAPLHQPQNLACIQALRELNPALPQVACFDTAFHAGQPALATTFALPAALTAEGIRRYGFHGLSYAYIAERLPQLLGPQAAEGRIIVAHLGSGASLCALKGRKSVASTMGFTALDGLMMARRCGAIDPGVILYLLQEKGMSAAAVSELLYSHSGLLGVSGISDDIRVLLASPLPEAKAAIDLFVYRIGRELGSLAATLGGLDALVFTAGIGENSPEVRRLVCQAATWLGISLDENANKQGGPCISSSKVSAWVVPTNEDLIIARHSSTFLADLRTTGLLATAAD